MRTFDMIVIGSGSGLEVSSEAADRGLSVAVERRPAPPRLCDFHVYELGPSGGSIAETRLSHEVVADGFIDG